MRKSDMPSSSARTSYSILAVFSICLSAAIVGTASYVLQVYQNQQASNAWWLPLWSAHFDSRGLQAIIGCSATILVVDMLIIVTWFAIKNVRSGIWETLLVYRGVPTRKKKKKWLKIADDQDEQAVLKDLAILILSGLASTVVLIAVIFPAVINRAAPGTDSMQTWTCRWAGVAGAPDNFSALCHESVSCFLPSFLPSLPPSPFHPNLAASWENCLLIRNGLRQRFAYFASVPLLVTHLCMLGLAVQIRLLNRFWARKLQFPDAVLGGEKGEELGSIVRADSESFGASDERDYEAAHGHGHGNGLVFDGDKGSPEIRVYAGA